MASPVHVLTRQNLGGITKDSRASSVVCDNSTTLIIAKYISIELATEILLDLGSGVRLVLTKLAM